MDSSKHRDDAAPAPRATKPVLYLVLVIVAVLLIELASLAGLFALRLAKPRLFAETFVDRQFDDLSEADRQSYLAKAFDPLLGWDNRPSSTHEKVNTVGEVWRKSFDADGARADGLPDYPLIATTYGDSFTLCAEVGDDETWQYFLGQSLRRDVKNFGVSAFGTGQALLKFKRHVAQGLVAPVSVLAIYEENIGRVVTSYHPFYQRRHGIGLGFKPSFRPRPDGAVRERPNPYADPALSLEDLRRLAKARADDDFWGARMLRLGLPGLLELLRGLTLGLDELEPGKPFPLWQREVGLRVMHHIVADFQRTAEGAGSTALILFIPHNRSLERPDPPSYAAFMAALRERYDDLIVVDIAAQDFERRRFNLAPFQGHASEYGNRVIAEAIEEALRPHLSGLESGG